MPTHRLLLAALLLVLTDGGVRAQAPGTVDAALAGIDPARLAAHVAWLANDSLEGRAPGTRGGALAAGYIFRQFERAGLEPRLQPVPLIGWRADTATTRAVAGRGLRGVRLARRELVLWSPLAHRTVDLAAPLVFAGYGIDAPEYDWNDYAGDVRGRVVLVLAGEPPAPEAFDGDALTGYALWRHKLEAAARQGASAVLIVHDDAVAGYGWDVVESSWGGEVLTLAMDTADALPVAAGWLHEDAARRLLARAGFDLATLQRDAAARAAPPLDLAIPMRLQLRARTRTFSSPNVIALLPGRHPTRARDWIVLTAHYDHLGMRGGGADSIYNGAYDNASGVALLLEVAAALATLRTPPDHSVLFAATTAEEAGLLGATWLTRSPPVPLERVIAALNLEGANLWGETEDIGAIGIERDALGTMFERAAAQEGMRAVAERAPQYGYLYRTDAMPFARAGIPVLSIEHGLTYRRRPAGWGDVVTAEYLRRHYHQPSDEFRTSFDFTGAVQQAKVVIRLVLAYGRP